ncbi:hypothetical protein J2W27_004056 [Variovorax boronicumulans]|uniref:HNH endonuclease n=1 Tax=Variovorax boronicumulans TaxID=436515 RepID=UPI0027829F48|nr:hypothetical protein [Variovorax boronicumulans]MDP9911932.1 hypothetical protein [Variovorax boronicumulans]
MNLTHAALQPPVMPSGIEADWLWDFLQKKQDKRPLLDRALAVVAMPDAEKIALSAWVQAVSALAPQFQPAPIAWPMTCPLADKANWAAFRTLMEAFYEKGFHAGLPYLEDGTPVAKGGVTYAQFVQAFRDRHRLNLNPDAREVCVLCGGLLGDTPHVDHWIIKSAVPLLSTCADNLTLICSTCNEAPNKGDQPVHTSGSFADWYHPYLRPGSGGFQLGYDLHAVAVHCSAFAPADQSKVSNLDRLLKLSSRLTGKFKAEYANQQGVLSRRELRRVNAGYARHTQQELENYVQQWAADLLPTEPDHEVHALLGQAMNEPARVQAWLAELAAVQ